MINDQLPDELTVTADGPVRVVTFNRPDDLNAVSKNLHWALANVWRQLAADLEATVVILTGAGRAFSAGGDLDWITSFLDDRAAGDESLREGAQIIEEVLRFPLPLIAAVNGAAFWPLLTPNLRSREYLYTGDRIPAATAVELGLATRVVPADDLLPSARALATRLAAQPAQALRETKRVANLKSSMATGGSAPTPLPGELFRTHIDSSQQSFTQVSGVVPKKPEKRVDLSGEVGLRIPVHFRLK